MTKLLAVTPERSNYAPFYCVTIADSFAQAKTLLLQAAQDGEPFEALDLPVSDEKEFWSFLQWMRGMGRNYPFSIFGQQNDFHFWSICQKARAQGFHVNT